MDRFTFVHTNASGHTVRNADSAKLLTDLLRPDEASARQAMIDRRTRYGCTAADSAKLLDQLIANHDGDNLVHALCFNEFATEKAAERFVFEVRA